MSEFSGATLMITGGEYSAVVRPLIRTSGTARP